MWAIEFHSNELLIDRLRIRSAWWW